MSDQETWLISLSIGPVQDFIDAALRTRDLWFGSHMLSEVSKAAAIAINDYDQQNQEGTTELIFPAANDSADLKPAKINVANRIVAEVQGDKKTVEGIVNAGKQAAQAQLDIFITQAKKKAAIGLRDDIWDIQTKRENLLELYGTAVRINDENYPDAWKHLSRLNSARKNSRDFLQPAKAPNEEGLYGLPKSSLDGRRETVLPKELSKNARRRLRMGDGEQLDVLGLVKRLAGDDPDQFTPTTRIAIDPWLREIKVKDAEKDQPGSTLADLRSKLGGYQGLLMDTGLMTKIQGNEKTYADMPFDASLLYRSSLDAIIAKVRQDKEFPSRSTLLEKLPELRKSEALKTAWDTYGQPCPYYAMLLADGDHMGALIKAAESKKDHKEISKCLSEFARSVPEIARKEEYRAHCIYAGGDDVLLMAPLDTVLDLAEELRQKFAENLKGIAQDLGRADKPPTFSVGIVIAHMQTPIGRVRRLVQQAEALAKGSDRDDPRNALAIIVAPRSGAEIPFRARWEKEPVNGLNELANLYRNEQLPSGFGYELRQLGLLVQGMEDEKEKAKEIARLELERILKRKNQSGGGEKVDKVIRGKVLAHADKKQEGTAPFAEVWQEHLIARWLGTHGEDRG